MNKNTTRPITSRTLVDMAGHLLTSLEAGELQRPNTNDPRLVAAIKKGDLPAVTALVKVAGGRDGDFQAGRMPWPVWFYVVCCPRAAAVARVLLQGGLPPGQSSVEGGLITVFHVVALVPACFGWTRKAECWQHVKNVLDVLLGASPLQPTMRRTLETVCAQVHTQTSVLAWACAAGNWIMARFLLRQDLLRETFALLPCHNTVVDALVRLAPAPMMAGAAMPPALTAEAVGNPLFDEARYAEFEAYCRQANYSFGGLMGGSGGAKGCSASGVPTTKNLVRVPLLSTISIPVCKHKRHPVTHTRMYEHTRVYTRRYYNTTAIVKRTRWSASTSTNKRHTTPPPLSLTTHHNDARFGQAAVVLP